MQSFNHFNHSNQIFPHKKNISTRVFLMKLLQLQEFVLRTSVGAIGSSAETAENFFETICHLQLVDCGYTTIVLFV